MSVASWCVRERFLAWLYGVQPDSGRRAAPHHVTCHLHFDGLNDAMASSMVAIPPTRRDLHGRAFHVTARGPVEVRIARRRRESDETLEGCDRGGRRDRAGGHCRGRAGGGAGLQGVGRERACVVPEAGRQGRDQVHHRVHESAGREREPAVHAEGRDRAGEGAQVQAHPARRRARRGQAGEQHAAAARPEGERDRLLSARSEGGAPRSLAGEEAGRAGRRDRRELRQPEGEVGPGHRRGRVAGPRHHGLPPGAGAGEGQAGGEGRPHRDRGAGAGAQVPQRPSRPSTRRRPG